MLIEEVKAECKKKISGGNNSEEIIKFLHTSGLTITESMKIIMELFKVSLGEAKTMVANHPVWNNVVNAALPLHSDLIRKID